MKENGLQFILDKNILEFEMELLQEVAQLAKRCLNMRGEERPLMTEVAETLKSIRSTCVTSDANAEDKRRDLDLRPLEPAGEQRPGLLGLRSTAAGSSEDGAAGIDGAAVAVATAWEEEGVEVEDPAGDGNRTRMEEAEAVEAAKMEPEQLRDGEHVGCFPAKWESLLPSIVSSLGTALAAGDVPAANSLLAAAVSLFSRFRNAFDTNTLRIDLKYCLEGFAAPLLEVFLSTSRRLQASAAASANPLELRPVFECLRLCCQFFYSLNSIDLPEFFEDHMREWMTEFRAFLTTSYPPPVEADGAPDALRAAVCDNLQRRAVSSP